MNIPNNITTSIF